jgi:hypothetical protein
LSESGVIRLLPEQSVAARKDAARFDEREAGQFRLPAMSIFFIRSAASMALWDLSGFASLIASINVGCSLSANTTRF